MRKKVGEICGVSMVLDDEMPRRVWWLTWRGGSQNGGREMGEELVAEDTILSNPKKLFSEMLTALAVGFAHYARRNKATGEWLQENYWPGSLGYQWEGLSLAFGDLLDQMACVIRGVGCA